MKRILLMPSPPNSGSIGSVTKCIGLAKRIREQGGEVGIVMGGNLVELIRKSGFKVYESPIPRINGQITSINNAMEFMMWTGILESQYMQDSMQNISGI